MRVLALTALLIAAAAQRYTLVPGFGTGLPPTASQVTAVALLGAELHVAQRGTVQPPFIVLDAATGVFIRAYGKFDVTLKSPHGMVSFNNTLWVTDIVNGTVLRLDPSTGAVLELIGSKGLGISPPQFSAPADLALGPGSALWVSDGDGGSANRVLRLSAAAPPSAKPAYVLGCGHNGTAPGCFSSPHSVAYAARFAHVWVADRGNNRLQAFAADGGKLLGEWAAADGCFGVAGAQPWGVRVDNKRGVLFVADGGPAGNPSGGEAGAVYALQLNAGAGWSKDSIGSCKGQLLQTLSMPNEATAKRAWVYGCSLSRARAFSFFAWREGPPARSSTSHPLASPTMHSCSARARGGRGHWRSFPR